MRIKSEVISVYIPSELKHRAEAAAKRQGRKLSQFVRWCVELEVEAELQRTARPRRAGEGRPSLKLKSGLFEDR